MLHYILHRILQLKIVGTDSYGNFNIVKDIYIYIYIHFIKLSNLITKNYEIKSKRNLKFNFKSNFRYNSNFKHLLKIIYQINFCETWNIEQFVLVRF